MGFSYVKDLPISYRRMKIKITFKDPDAVYDAIKAAVLDNIPSGLTEEEVELISDNRIHDTASRLGRWLTFNELITIEFDLDKGTAVVSEN